MALIDFIEKLQKKPRAAKIRIMWASSILGTAVIFVFWLWSLSALLSRTVEVDEKNTQALQRLNEIKKEMPGLWQSLSAGISNVISAAKDDLAASPSATPPASPSERLRASSGDYGTDRLPIEQ